MGDAHCWDCRRATVVVSDHHAVGDTVSECRRLQNRCCDPDQSLISGFNTIATMCDRLGLVARIKGRACEILKKTDERLKETDQLFRKRRNRDATLAAYLYLACEIEHSSRSYREICSVANGATVMEIISATRYVRAEYGKCHSVEEMRHSVEEMSTFNASDAMRRFHSPPGQSCWKAFQNS